MLAGRTAYAVAHCSVFPIVLPGFEGACPWLTCTSRRPTPSEFASSWAACFSSACNLHYLEAPQKADVVVDSEFKSWRRCMGVEPTLDQEFNQGRAAVLKTAGELIQGAFACSSLCLRTAFPVDTCAHCSCVTRDCTRFGVKSGVKNDSGAALGRSVTRPESASSYRRGGHGRRDQNQRAAE